MIQAERRFLINLPLTSARLYRVPLTISRESDGEGRQKVILKAHPDKGGREGDSAHYWITTFTCCLNPLVRVGAQINELPGRKTLTDVFAHLWHIFLQFSFSPPLCVRVAK